MKFLGKGRHICMAFPNTEKTHDMTDGTDVLSVLPVYGMEESLLRMVKSVFEDSKT